MWPVEGMPENGMDADMFMFTRVEVLRNARIWMKKDSYQEKIAPYTS